MKIKSSVYIISLIVIFTSILLVVEFPDSGRINMIAGGLTLVGLLLNIAAFTMKNNKRIYKK